MRFRRSVVVLPALAIVACVGTAQAGSAGGEQSVVTAHAADRDAVRYLGWDVLGVSADQRTLQIGYVQTGCSGDVSVREHRTRVAIEVTQPPRPGMVCPQRVSVIVERVRLDARIAGRKIGGPRRGLGGMQRDIPVAVEDFDSTIVPRVGGLRAFDARRALAAVGLRMTFRGRLGAQVRSQRPKPGSRVATGTKVRLAS